MVFKKTRKIGILPKGIVHEFGQKVEVFLMFCVYQKTIEKKVFADVLDTKEAFKDYKNICLWKTPNYKGLVHGFRQKEEISSTLILMQKRSRKSIWGRCT